MRHVLAPTREGSVGKGVVEIERVMEGRRKEKIR
jgi:hypothetical protein